MEALKLTADGKLHAKPSSHSYLIVSKERQVQKTCLRFVLLATLRARPGNLKSRILRAVCSEKVLTKAHCTASVLKEAAALLET